MAEIEDLTPIMLRDIRRGQRELAQGLRDLSDLVRRQGARMDKRFLNVEEKFVELEKTIFQVRDEIELTVKMEVGGRMAGFESRLEARQEEVLARMDGTFGPVTGDDKPD